MLLVIDIGNTNVVLGLMDHERKVLDTCRIQSRRKAIRDDFGGKFHGLCQANGVSIRSIEGAVVSSVVPEVNAVIAAEVKKQIKKTPLFVEDPLALGLKIETDHPDKVGKDMLVDAVAALEDYEGDLIVFDLGTATTCSLITADHCYKGHLIIPGVGISKRALAERASQLPFVRLEKPEHLIGRNTVESIQSGLINGHAAMMDGLIDRIFDELGHEATVVATGGIAPIIAGQCRHKIHVDADLMLRGLWYIYYKQGRRTQITESDICLQEEEKESDSVAS